MTTKLDKRRDIAGIIGLAVTPILVIAPLLIMHPKDELIAGALLFFAGLLYIAIKNGKKPAAWIQNDVLHIRSGMISEDKIPKSLVTSMRYEIGHSVDRPYNGNQDAHILYIDMKGYQEWPLTISDPIEHLDDLRLYHFINDNFWALGDIVNANA